MQKVIRIAYLILVLDITSLFAQFSITPYLAKRLGFNTIWFGYLQTTVGIIQLLGGPVFGRFADLHGARAALTLSSLSSAVYFVILGCSTNVPLLFISKLPAVFMHGMPGVQMVVTDLTEPGNRASALGRLGLCFGVGMIMGSSLGGTLSTRYGESFAAFVAAAGSLLNAALVVKFIPAHTKKRAETDSATATDKNLAVGAESVFSLSDITGLMRFPGVREMFTIKIISGLPSVVFQVMFSIIAMNFFQLKAEQTGYLLSYFGLVQMVMQGGVIGRLTGKYSERTLLLLSIGTASIVGLAQALMTNVQEFCAVVIPMMFSLCTFNVITDTILTKSVPSSYSGTMLGLCSSVQALLRTVGPTIGGFLYQNYGVLSFGYIQCSVNLLLFLYLLKSNFRKTEEYQS
ncbi:solute carrier family 22 member 18 [Polyodon spathula]|uniref:solute carrier family 22 member 18 n=1 Tax=Polyodon spathula TaxID=7913 RepID=UPI001B7EF21E|nr:solute carrier family 22 member 18 [Polyodon spathula]XP_041074980.1 solute carrier family 22 member 18 [Polyodon spathula]